MYKEGVPYPFSPLAGTPEGRKGGTRTETERRKLRGEGGGVVDSSLSFLVAVGSKKGGC
jgi:hypothetical protein